MTTARKRIFPVILSGGAGTRLWPLSRENSPKQLLRLTGGETLLQQAASRSSDPELFEPLIIIASVQHRFMVAEQLREIGLESSTIIVEPSARNTAAAAAVAALTISRIDPEGLLLIMAADHVIRNVADFRMSVSKATEAAGAGLIVLFGIKPNAPAAGYGYIKVGAPLDGLEPVHRVAAFVEKPDLGTAERYLGTGEYLWNSGIVLLQAGSLLAELSQHEPDIIKWSSNALDWSSRDSDFVRLDPEAFGRCPSISLDYAVMERTASAAVIPAEFDWADMGSWTALWEIGDHDENGNVLSGEVLLERTTNSYIHTEGPLIATIGVDGLVVVATADAFLVADRRHDQEIRKVVERLRAGNLGRI